ELIEVLDFIAGDEIEDGALVALERDDAVRRIEPDDLCLCGDRTKTRDFSGLGRLGGFRLGKSGESKRGQSGQNNRWREDEFAHGASFRLREGIPRFGRRPAPPPVKRALR